MQTLAQIYNATAGALQQWLQAQANATKSLRDFLASSVRGLFGTIPDGLLHVDVATHNAKRTAETAGCGAARSGRRRVR